MLGYYAGAAAYMQKSGVPSWLLPVVIALQLGGGVLIAAGIMTRFAALAFAVFCVLTAILFHWQFADRNQLLHFQKDLAIAGGFLVSRLLRTGKLVDRPLPRAVKKLATSRPERSPADQSRRERRAEAFPQEAGEL